MLKIDHSDMSTDQYEDEFYDEIEERMKRQREMQDAVVEHFDRGGL